MLPGERAHKQRYWSVRSAVAAAHAHGVPPCEAQEGESCHYFSTPALGIMFVLMSAHRCSSVPRSRLLFSRCLALAISVSRLAIASMVVVAPWLAAR